MTIIYDRVMLFLDKPISEYVYNKALRNLHQIYHTGAVMMRQVCNTDLLGDTFILITSIIDSVISAVNISGFGSSLRQSLISLGFKVKMESVGERYANEYENSFEFFFGISEKNKSDFIKDITTLPCYNRFTYENVSSKIDFILSGINEMPINELDLEFSKLTN